MSSNPTLDRFWTEFHGHEPSARLSGIDANKPGYHERRVDLPADDYSVGQVAADKRGRGTVASAIDITLPDGPNSKMTLYTGRLKAAALARDPRLWLRGGPTLREFIGTDDGRRVYCYVFTGGVPLGVGSDSGPDWGRDGSHLWHIHLSVIRQYAEDWAALDAVLSVLKGESLAEWRARTEDDMDAKQATQLAWVDARLEAIGTGLDDIAKDRPGAGQDVWLVRAVKDIAEAVAATRADVAELRARPPAGVTLEMHEEALRRVLGSVDGATPAE